MKDGRITQAGKYDDILNSGTDFMELVGAHKNALSALDSAEARSASESTSMSMEDGSMASANGVVQKQENKDGKADDIVGSKGQIIQEEEREKGKVSFSVYWKYITMAYGGALVPFILLAMVLFQLLQIGSNYWMAWASPVSEDMKPAVGSSMLIIVYVALAIGSSFCVLVRSSLLVTAGYKTATLLFNKMHFCIFRAPMSFFDSTPSGRILNRVSGKMCMMLLYWVLQKCVVCNFCIALFFRLNNSFVSLTRTHMPLPTHTHSLFLSDKHNGYKFFLLN
jgi:ATP-binding cassette subfamily C (CFTR/MRP) protein 2